MMQQGLVGDCMIPKWITDKVKDIATEESVDYFIRENNEFSFTIGVWRISDGMKFGDNCIFTWEDVENDPTIIATVVRAMAEEL